MAQITYSKQYSDAIQAIKQAICRVATRQLDWSIEKCSPYIMP